PRFIAAHLVADSDDRDDDKVYFFFTEKVTESGEREGAIHTRVGRVCANDVGGQRVLVNKWSTFIKARLVCSVPGPHGIDTHFNQLEDVFMLRTKDERNPDVYGIFSTISRVSLCPPPRYSDVFQGYACPSKITNQPGREFSSTKDFPDAVLQFARGHPLMWRPVTPARRRPVLLRANVEYRLTQLVVDRVEAEDGQYDVMFIGTDVGRVLKVISLRSGNSLESEEVTLEELQVFKVPTPITSMDISAKRQAVFVGSPVGVAQLKLHRCETYGKACAECCLARDPYCAWDGTACARFLSAGKRRYRRQDVRYGNPALQCVDQNLSSECASVQPWLAQAGTDRKEEVKLDERVMSTEQGLLFRRVFRQDGGVYVCRSREHGFTQTLARLTLHVLHGEALGELLARDNPSSSSSSSVPGPESNSKDRSTGGYRGWPPCVSGGSAFGNRGGGGGGGGGGSPGLTVGQSRSWFKDIMQLIGPSNLPHVEEYCERMWCHDKLRRKHKSMVEKYRQAQESARKVRSRSPGERNRTPRDLRNVGGQ
ncbi:hypothetical protein CRUP_032485, partial [Coryphaenoides rupestris]